MLNFARLLMLLGLILLVTGGIIYGLARLNIPVGRLPGDIRLQGSNFTCLIGLGTSLLLSILLTIILNVIIRLMNR
jgi:hypothetical protein